MPRFWACSAVLAAVCLCWAWSARAFGTPSVEEGLARIAAGRKAQLQDRIQDALSEYADPSVADSPLWECGSFWRAQLLAQTGQVGQARPLYERLFRAAPEPSYRNEAAAFLADDAESRADAAGAVTYLQALLDARPDDPAPRARLATLLGGLHRESEARDHALWLWTRSPSSPAAVAYFRAHPSWILAFSALPHPDQLERLRSLAREGALNTLAIELRKFRPVGVEESGWAKYMQGRILEARGGAAEAVKVYASVAAPSEARFASLGRMGSALPKAGLPERDRETVEALVISLPQPFEGRQKALVSLMKWRIAQPNERRARTLAEALLAGKIAQADACEYLFEAAWTRWMASDRRGAEALWRLLVDRLPAESDYYHASGYALYRLGRLTPLEAAQFRETTLREDRYGYFGYRMRGSLPSRMDNPGGPPAPPVGLPGSHVEKARLLLSAGLASDSVREFQLALALALALEEDLAAKERILWAQSVARSAAEDYAGAIRTARVLYPRVFNENGDALPPETWRLLYPVPFQDDVMKSAQEADLPYLLACSVIRQESLWDPRAVSRSGARGLMQLMPATASALARQYKFPFTPPDCYSDPAWNTRAGCAYLRQLLDRYRGRLDLALAAYNAGPGRVSDWVGRPGCPKDPDLFVESIPFKETRSYVRRIMLNCWEYGRLYQGFAPPLSPGAIELVAREGE